MEKNENFVDIHVSFSLNDLDKLAKAITLAKTIFKECEQQLETKDMVHTWFAKAFTKDETNNDTETKTVDTSDSNSSSMSDWD